MDSLQKESAPGHTDFSPGKLIMDFWPPEVQENTFVFFKATKFVVICYSVNGKLMQRANE